VKRQTIITIFVAVVLLSLLAVAVTFMVDTWQRTDAQMSVHGWIALSLGVFFSLLVGCGLMALMFYSSRRGYDERAQSGHDRRAK
jgi:TRAP-type C4-dicarboxylate transport system permease small subunit